jgi:D-glycero-D-manno-heptose 1,7-bisphosphate phosphatase
MSRALFLDRDGVVNEDSGYVCRPEDFRFVRGIFDFCRAAQSKGYLLVVVTNQSGIARGYFTESDYESLSSWMRAEFLGKGIRIDAAFHCPFHPDHGIGAYKRESFDRKPSPGMIIKARDRFGIDLGRSVLIGDKDSDIEAGRRAGVGRLLFLKGRYALTPAADAIACETLEEAMAWL